MSNDAKSGRLEENNTRQDSSDSVDRAEQKEVAEAFTNQLGQEYTLVALTKYCGGKNYYSFMICDKNWSCELIHGLANHILHGPYDLYTNLAFSDTDQIPINKFSAYRHFTKMSTIKAIGHMPTIYKIYYKCCKECTSS